MRSRLLETQLESLLSAVRLTWPHARGATLPHLTPPQANEEESRHFWSRHFEGESSVSWESSRLAELSKNSQSGVTCAGSEGPWRCVRVMRRQ